MVIAVDVYYKDQIAKAVGVLFEWEDFTVSEKITENLNNIEEYIPGEFYKRELPCILKVLEKVDLNKLEAIVIDGYVYVNNDLIHGLGGILWTQIGGKIPVIGVAKTSFYANQETVVKIKRGQSNNPLYISSIGTEVEQAAQLIQQMKGNYRLPDILKALDHMTKHD